MEASCSTWLHAEIEYLLEPDIMMLFPEKHDHQKMLLYHNIAGQQTYRSVGMPLQKPPGERPWST